MSRGYGRDNSEPKSAYRKPAPNTCPSCGSTDMWQSAHDESLVVCRRCHPPVPGAEKGTSGRVG